MEYNLGFRVQNLDFGVYGSEHRSKGVEHVLNAQWIRFSACQLEVI